MGEQPDVSVVIPTKDRWRLLERTLRSALRQEDVLFEVIVVDDGGTDGTAQRVAALGDARVAVIRNSTNGGAAAARNIGIEGARGEWVAFLDDDDLWAPRKLVAQLAAAQEASAEWGYGAAVRINACLDVIVAAEPPPPPAEIAAELRTHNAVPAAASNLIVRRAVVASMRGFDEHFRHASDWDLSLRLAARGRPAVCSDVLVGYVDHPGGLHRRAAEHLSEFRALQAKHSRVGVELDGVILSRWVAGIQRREGDRHAALRTYLKSTIHDRNPGNIARAAGLLVGERVMSMGRRSSRSDNPSEPGWLAEYR